MSCLASVQLTAIRDVVKAHVHGGLALTSEDTAAFVRRLNTALELIRDTEDENRMLTAAIHARAAGKPCLRLIQQHDGGAA
jgi:hypothetical protein